MQNAYPFKTPVDTILYKDYLTKVKSPIDFGTIKTRLDAGQYTDNLVGYLKDMRQVFQNAYTYNAVGTDVFAMAKQLEVMHHCLYEALKTPTQSSFCTCMSPQSLTCI